MKKILYKIFSNISVFLWCITGILTIGSLFNSATGIFINITVGMMFILTSYFLYLKSKNFLKLINDIDQFNDNSAVKYQKVLFFELVFSVIVSFIGLISLSAVISRVFAEGLTVFG